MIPNQSSKKNIFNIKNLQQIYLIYITPLVYCFLYCLFLGV